MSELLVSVLSQKISEICGVDGETTVKQAVGCVEELTGDDSHYSYVG